MVMEGLSFKAGHALNPEAPCAARQNGPARDPPVDFILNVYAEFQQNGPARATHLTPREPQAGPSPPPGSRLRQIHDLQFISNAQRAQGSPPGSTPALFAQPETIATCAQQNSTGAVAPHAGAWIETSAAPLLISRRAVAPTRGRGSNRATCAGIRAGHRSPPTRGGVAHPGGDPQVISRRSWFRLDSAQSGCPGQGQARQGNRDERQPEHRVPAIGRQQPPGKK